jgi:hypothetical protein
MKRLIVLATALAFSAGAAAQLYKWKDANGRIRYGDTPPPGVDATTIRGPSSYSPPAPAADAKNGKGDKKEPPLTPEQAFEKRQKERAEAEQKADKERADAEAKRVNCEQAQTQLRTLETGQRIATVNAAGERAFLDDDQRAAAQARAEKAVANWCK